MKEYEIKLLKKAIKLRPVLVEKCLIFKKKYFLMPIDFGYVVEEKHLSKMCKASGLYRLAKYQFNFAFQDIALNNVGKAILDIPDDVADKAVGFTIYDSKTKQCHFEDDISNGIVEVWGLRQNRKLNEFVENKKNFYNGEIYFKDEIERLK